MTERSEATGQADQGDDARIVISGLDEGAPSTAPEQQGAGNVSPTDAAVELLQSQRDRGEPEDEDG